MSVHFKELRDIVLRVLWYTGVLKVELTANRKRSDIAVSETFLQRFISVVQVSDPGVVWGSQVSLSNQVSPVTRCPLVACSGSARSVKGTNRWFEVTAVTSLTVRHVWSEKANLSLYRLTDFKWAKLQIILQQSHWLDNLHLRVRASSSSD